MNKYIKMFLIIFVIFIFNIFVFSDKINTRQKAIEFMAIIVQNFPEIKTLIGECPNCHNYTSEQGFYYVDGRSENTVCFYAFCKKCNYLEIGSNGDNGSEYFYRGTK
jgi:hypothetical protein